MLDSPAIVSQQLLNHPIKKEAPWPDAGLNVDELWRVRRRRVPNRPQSSLRPLEGSFALLKTEYRRRYRRNSAYLRILEEAVRRGRVRPRDLLELEGDRLFSPEYKHHFTCHPLPGKTLRKRYTSLKPEGELIFSKESSSYAGKPGERGKLVKRKSNLKSEGNLEFLTEYDLFKGEHGERRCLQRRPTTLKAEGDVEYLTEYDNFKGEQGEKPCLERRSTNLKLEGDLDLSTENLDNYKGEQGEKRTLERRETTLKSEDIEEGMKRISETQEQFRAPGKADRADIVIQEGTLHPEGGREFRPKYTDEFGVKRGPKATFQYPSDNLKNVGPAKGDSETKAEYRGVQATRPVVHRHPDNLKPEGAILADTTEIKSQYREIHPSRPVLHRNNSNLKPEGEFVKSTEKRDEFRNFSPTRPTIHRTNSNLKPEGEFERTTEKNAEYRDFHPTRPTLHRNNSILKPEGEFERSTEQKGEYRDFHPSRPTIYRTQSNLKPEGEFSRSTEIKSEYKDFHPQRPVLQRNNSNLKPEGEFERYSEVRAEYKDFHPSRPTIYKSKSNLKPEGEFTKSTEIRTEYKDHHPKRPVINRVNTNLKPEGGFERATEVKTEYRDFHPERPVIHRVNSQLKPEGGFERSTENKSEYRDFHPERPKICRVNSQLRPKGEFCKETEVRSEYKNFQPQRPIIYRPGSSLKPEGEVYGFHDKTEYAEYPSQRPVIYEHATHLQPGNQVTEGKALRPKIRYEGEVEIREERGRTAPPEERKVSFAPKHRRVPGTATLPRSRSKSRLLSEDSTTSTTTEGSVCSSVDGNPSFRLLVENADDSKDKAFVVLDDNNNSQDITNSAKASKVSLVATNSAGSVHGEPVAAWKPEGQDRALDSVLGAQPKYKGSADIARAEVAASKGLRSYSLCYGQPCSSSASMPAASGRSKSRVRPKAARNRKPGEPTFWDMILPLFGMAAKKKTSFKHDSHFLPMLSDCKTRARIN